MSRAAALVCDAGSPSAAAELAWLLDLLVQSARYAEPALDELDRSLLPGIARLRGSIRERYRALWNDSLGGCPELLIAAGVGGFVDDDEPAGLLAWLSSAARKPLTGGRLLSEPPRERRAIRRRLNLLTTNVTLRRAYRDIVAEVWEVAQSAWARRGRATAARAAAEWSRRLVGATTVESIASLLPPRHPLTHEEWTGSETLARRRRWVVVPLYFCMSGGQVADLGDRVFVGVPASSLEPIRRTRDAAFVAGRARILAEPTRVRILIHLMRTPSGVMQITRALGMTQPTVSQHVRVLARAGLIHAEEVAGKTVYSVSKSRSDRLVEDIRGTLARWAARS